jgi:sulfur carrier protein
MSLPTSEQITVNGAAHELLPAETLASLIGRLLGADRGGLAVAVNGAVIPMSRWADHQLTSGDQLEVLTAFQGG